MSSFRARKICNTRVRGAMATLTSTVCSIAKVFSFALLIMIYCDNSVIAEEMLTNSWAVKFRGSQQEAEEWAQKHGFSYDKHVSQFLARAFKRFYVRCTMMHRANAFDTVFHQLHFVLTRSETTWNGSL